MNTHTPKWFRNWIRQHRELPDPVYWLAGLLIRLLFRTYRVRLIDRCGFLDRERPWPAVFALWHNRLFFLPLCFPLHIRRRTTTLASISRDGEYAARLISVLGLSVLRGSSSRGGHQALRRMKQQLAFDRSVVLTVDGPRGPRYSVQPGVVVLAGLTGRPLIPISLNATRRWELGGWDRTQIPFPFSRVDLEIGAPLHVPRPKGREETELEIARVRRALLRITRDGPTLPLPPADLRKARRQWPVRRTALLRDSDRCQRIREPEGTWLLRRPFSVDTARAALDAHRECVRQGALIKDDAKRRLSRVQVAGTSLVVKEFRKSPRWYGPWAPARRAWLSHYRLEIRGLPGPRAHAWLRGPHGCNWIVMEDMGKAELTEILRDTREAVRRRRLIESTARILARTHLARVFQPDFKIANLVPQAPESSPKASLALVDVDAVRFDRTVTPLMRRNNIRQVLDSFPETVTPFERVRFLAVYRREIQMDRDRFRDLLGIPVEPSRNATPSEKDTGP